MADVARPIPAAVFCWMVGCDPARGPELAATSAVALQAFSGDPAVMGDVQRAIADLSSFARELISEKEARTGRRPDQRAWPPPTTTPSLAVTCGDC